MIVPQKALGARRGSALGVYLGHWEGEGELWL